MTKRITLCVIALFLILSIVGGASAVAISNVVPFTLGTVGSATALWSATEYNTGSYSVHMTTSATNDYSYLTFTPKVSTIDDITSLSFYYKHISNNEGAGPRIGIMIQDGANYYLVVSGAAATSIGAWNKADGITGSGLITGGSSDQVWWYGTCDSNGQNYHQQGGPVSFSTIKSTLNGNILSLSAYMGVVTPSYVGSGEAYVDDVEINGLTYYGKIQDSIDIPHENGDTINVGAGTYAESITVNKQVSIIGAGNTSTIIQPSIDQNAISIPQDNVLIKDLKIITSNSGTNPNIAVKVEESDDVEINNVIIETTGDKAMGIWVGNGQSDNLDILNNKITLNGKATGIYAEEVTPAHSGWTISWNTISAPNLGVDLELYDVNNVLVDSNTFGISGSVSLTYSSEKSNVGTATISNNIFKGNGNVAGATPTIWAESDFITGDGGSSVNGITITGNTFENWVNYAIRIGEGNPNYDDVTGVSITLNTFKNPGTTPLIQNNSGAATISNNNITVESGNSIQNAINVAGNGYNTINVAAGTYTENVNVNKQLTLQGASSATVTVTAATQTISVFTVSVSNVNISGFTATHTTMTGNEGYAGIRLIADVANCNIYDNILRGNQYGILLLATENTITPGNNIFTNNDASSNGVSGIEMQHTYGNTFINNIANSNKYGFKLDSSRHNTFTSNTANSNQKGFYLTTGDGVGSNDNTFTSNTANSNTRYGLAFGGVSNSNTLTGNTFDSNVISGVRLEDTVTSLDMQNNNIINSPTGIDIATTETDVSTWTLSKNKITGNTVGVSNNGVGTLNAENNYWGSVNPNFTALTSGSVDYRPWYIDSAKTRLNEEITSCSPGDTGTDNYGTDVGECEVGIRTRTCNADGSWGSWVITPEAIGPTSEICTGGLDEDCDGYIDTADTDCSITDYYTKTQANSLFATITGLATAVSDMATKTWVNGLGFITGAAADAKYVLQTNFNSLFSTQFGTKTTNDLTEGTNNKYFTDARAKSAIDSAYPNLDKDSTNDYTQSQHDVADTIQTADDVNNVEIDPEFAGSPAHEITLEEISNWNAADSWLESITASTIEINRLIGATSNIQAQLNSKLSSESDPQVSTLTANQWCRADGTGNTINCDVAPVTNNNQLANGAGYLTTETDPFTAWDKSTGISITESQISDLKTYITSESDPTVTLDKLKTLVSNDFHNLGGAETDPVWGSEKGNYYTKTGADSAYVNEGQENSISTSMIQDDSISTSKIKNNAITTSEIKDSAVTDAKISSMDASKLTGTIDDARIPSEIARDSEVTSADAALQDKITINKNNISALHAEDANLQGKVSSLEERSVKDVDGVNIYLAKGWNTFKMPWFILNGTAQVNGLNVNHNVSVQNVLNTSGIGGIGTGAKYEYLAYYNGAAWQTYVPNNSSATTFKNFPTTATNQDYTFYIYMKEGARLTIGLNKPE